MSGTLSFLVPVALLAVTLALALGLWNMLRAGNANRSQKLMRWRVVLQFFAIAAVMAAVYFTRG